MALRTSKLSKNCASRGLIGPHRPKRALLASRGAGGGGGRPRRPPLATCLAVSAENVFLGYQSITFRDNKKCVFCIKCTRDGMIDVAAVRVESRAVCAERVFLRRPPALSTTMFLSIWSRGICCIRGGWGML